MRSFKKYRPAVAIVVAAGGMLLAGGSAAQAATVAIEDGTVVITAAPGETNNLRAGSRSLFGTQPMTVTDTGAPLTAGHGCQTLDANNVLCPEPQRTPKPIVIYAGDGNDQVLVDDNYVRNVSVYGQRGNDTIHVGNGMGAPALLDGGQGDDTLITYENGEGPPVLRGGPGNDTLTMNELGSAKAYGGAGSDRLVYTAWTPNPAAIVLDGDGGDDTYTFGYKLYLSTIVPGGGTDTLDQSTSRSHIEIDLATCPDCVQRVIGTPSDDILIGDANAQTIFGAAGNDTIDGGGGRDTLGGQDGDDAITSRDTAADTVDCGSGADGVTADRRDLVNPDCETVTR